MRFFRLLIMVLLCLPFSLQAQEFTTNGLDDDWKLTEFTTRTMVNDDDPCNFTYLYDTLDLPFIDDFSTNLQRQFDAQVGDAGLIDTLFYNLYVGGVPEPDSAQFMDNVSYHIYRDTTATGADTSWSDTIPPFSITVCDPCTYPMSCTDYTVYYNFDLVDTVYLGTTDTIWYAADYSQDTLRRYFVPDGTASLWIDRDACINGTFPDHPPTIGVATMDGMNEYGYPYNFVSPSLQGQADYLTSVPINLGIDPGDFLPYEPADSIYLSFFYQPQGLGDQPNATDSLKLQFWSPVDVQWYDVWGMDGKALQPFEQILIPVIDNKYLASGFQFRFVNTATLSGALDHWHIDYVRMYKNRTYTDTIIDDMAFVYPESTIIDDYTAMHWHHFMTAPGAFMRDTVTTYQFNLSNTAKLVTSGMQVEWSGGVLNNFTHPNTPNANPDSFENPFHKITGDYLFQYDTALADTCINFDIKFWLNTTPDVRRENDTMRFTQHFGNYYAYDDGSAEHGYYLVSGSSPKMAVEYSIPIPDTLVGVWIYWLPVGASSENESFFLTAWDQSGGQPGTIISQNTTFTKPIYGLGKNAFAWYPFDDSLVAVSGTFYVGWQQTSSGDLKVGMDKNNNNQNKMYYDIGGGWNTTSFEGSWMIRPAFAGDKYELLLDVEEPTEPLHFTMYPNPTAEVVNLFMDDSFNELQLQVLDLSGRLVIQQQFTGAVQLDVSMMQQGIYVVQLFDTITGRSATEKLVIQK